MARITTIPLLLNRSLSAGDASTSDPIDLRYTANNGIFSLAINMAAGTSTTCGTTIFSYTGCSISNGTYISPASNGTFATAGPSIVSKIASFSPSLTPFMKIISTQTGAGTAGANTKITAELNIQ